jgi:hypothetical protein
MPKNNAVFGLYKVSERKRDGANKRIIFYITPLTESFANIEDYSEKYLIGIKRNSIIERYPECIPNTLSVELKTEVIEYLKKRNEQFQFQKNSFVEGERVGAGVDFDVFENIFGE